MGEQQSVEALVRRAKGGDREAFTELVEAYRDRLLASIRSRGAPRGDNAVEPEDLLSEVLLRAFESLDRFEYRGEASFLKWLFGIARHLQLNASRQAKRTLSLDSAERAESSDPSPSRLLGRDERFQRLERAIALLPESYREVVHLARIEGLKTREVAERLGKSSDAVKHLLARALRLLRENMGDTESLSLPDRRLSREDDRDE